MSPAETPAVELDLRRTAEAVAVMCRSHPPQNGLQQGDAARYQSWFCLLRIVAKRAQNCPRHGIEKD